MLKWKKKKEDKQNPQNLVRSEKEVEESYSMRKQSLLKGKYIIWEDTIKSRNHWNEECISGIICRAIHTRSLPLHCCGENKLCKMNPPFVK